MITDQLYSNPSIYHYGSSPEETQTASSHDAKSWVDFLEK